MKKIDNYGRLFLLCLTSSLMIFEGCLSDNDETIALKERPNYSAYSSFINNDGKYVFCNNNDYGTDAYIMTNSGADNFEKINIVFDSADGNTAYGTVFFSNGKVRSLTIKDVTYTFHENSDKKIDVAVTSNGYTDLFASVATSDYLNHSGSKWIRTFADINGAIEIIKLVNNQVDTASPLCEKTRDIQNYLDRLEDSTMGFASDDTGDNLAEQASDGEDPGTIDDSGSKDNEKGASDNTDQGNGAISSGLGALKVTLTWKFSADIDVHIFEPGYSGTIPDFNKYTGHIFYSAKTHSFTDGYLDIDNMEGYYINPQTGESNKTLAAVENVYWKDNPKNGKFYVYLHYYSGSSSGTCNVAIFRNGKTIMSRNVTMSSTYHNNMLFIASVNMPSGTISYTRSAVEIPSQEELDLSLLPFKGCSINSTQMKD